MPPCSSKKPLGQEIPKRGLVGCCFTPHLAIFQLYSAWEMVTEM